jgi:hypothetical protein
VATASRTWPNVDRQFNFLKFRTYHGNIIQISKLVAIGELNLDMDMDMYSYLLKVNCAKETSRVGSG